MANPIYGRDKLLNPQPSTLFDDVYKELEKRKSGQLLDKSQQRRDRDWSRLANQVVGAEVFL